jgi:glutathione S-transferase
MALDAAQISLEHREVKLSAKPTAMLKASPKGTVPVLVLSNDEILEESLDIMDWALAKHDPENWRQAGARERAEAFLADFKDALDRYKYASRYNDKAKRGDVDETQRTAAFMALHDFTAPLNTQNFLHSPEQPGYLDVATFPFVRQFANTEPQWWSAAAPPTLQHWLNHMVSLPRFQRIMEKHQVWIEAA